MTDPKIKLLEGVKCIEQILAPCGFQFQFRGEGKGAGGYFAWGEFVREDRRIELHFRYSLGLIRYHVGNHSASHESYMKELGVWDQCRYPGFSENYLDAFEDLAHDIALAEDFLTGAAEVLKRAAATEAILTADQMRQDMARYVGDVRNLESLKVRFHEGRYRDVVAIAAELKYPERMCATERRMVEMAKKRAGAGNSPTSSRFARFLQKLRS